MHRGLWATNVPGTFSPLRAASTELTFRDIDVLSPAYPDREADLIYSRFLLTHLHRPADVLTTSVQHLRSGGRLLLEETAALFSPVPALSRTTILSNNYRRNTGGDIDRKETGSADRRRFGGTHDLSLARNFRGRNDHGAATRDESGNLEVRSVHAGNPWPVRSRRSRSRVERDRRNDRPSWSRCVIPQVWSECEALAISGYELRSRMRKGRYEDRPPCPPPERVGLSRPTTCRKESCGCEQGRTPALSARRQ